MNNHLPNNIYIYIYIYIRHRALARCVWVLTLPSSPCPLPSSLCCFSIPCPIPSSLCPQFLLSYQTVLVTVSSLASF